MKTNGSYDVWKAPLDPGEISWHSFEGLFILIIWYKIQGQTVFLTELTCVSGVLRTGGGVVILFHLTGS